MYKTIFIPYQDEFGITIQKISPSIFDKCASDDLARQIDDFVSKNPPDKNESYLLINALGSMELWGSNSRGDAFPRDELKVESPYYGYKTFEIFGNFFVHHKNKVFKDRLGEVRKALWIHEL